MRYRLLFREQRAKIIFQARRKRQSIGTILNIPALAYLAMEDGYDGEVQSSAER